MGNHTRFIKSAFEDLLAVIEGARALVALSKTNCPGVADLKKLEQIMQERDVDYLATEVPSAIASSVDAG